MRKKDRQQLLSQLLNERAIRKQEDFVEILAQEDIFVTQATISRDIKEMKLVKVPSPEGGYQYSLPQESQDNTAEKLHRLLNDGLISVDIQEKLLYLRTLPGSAIALGKLLQSQFSEELFAAINDDDGLLLIARSEAQAQELQEFLIGYL
ncbi:arginine repressor [Enterococcus sp. HY326]|uniref:arginine repressor n=1 Tax=Enterococcus sp. HY326 TaxID=2971265 RepID=UPI002240A723|nr:ArgR family transcriptional regulator [Enterococcus sp. HY326]